MNKVYCRYCGKQIDENATFCTHCGKEQNVNKVSSWNVDKLRNTGINLAQKFFALVRVPYDYVKTIKIPKMSRDKADLIRRRLKKAGKVLLALAVVALVVGAGVWGYVYYNDEYLPKKRLDEACADILNKMHSDDKSVCIEYCRKTLLTLRAFVENNESWGYNDVDNGKITEHLQGYQNEAFRMIENEAYNGNPNAQYLLGQMYIGHIVNRYVLGGRPFVEREYTVNPDTTKAIYWYNEAAQKDYLPAFSKMGYAYEHGIGVHQDIRKAIDFYKSGAEQGEAYAQANYGRLFRDGVRIRIGSHKETRTTDSYYGGNQKVRQYYDYNKMEFITVYKEDVDDYETLIPQDIETAKYWWQKAAEQGNEYAKELLQKVYE